jgi:hypothetical protein
MAPFCPGKTVLASEEEYRLWSMRQPPLDFGDNLTFLHPQGPSRRAWSRFIDQVLELLPEDDPLGLLVIDTATRIMPLGCSNARVQRRVLEDVGLVADHAGVLILNQSRNMHRPLAAFADIVIEMNIPRWRTLNSASGRDAAGHATRRRIFTGVGRPRSTLESVTAELNAEGTDYVLADGSIAPPPPRLATLHELFAARPDPLTHKDLLARWPGDPPREDSLWRALAKGLETGLLAMTGAGTKTDPRRFTLSRKAAS